MQRSILLCGHDQLLLETRRLILERADNSVFTAQGVSEAMLILMHHRIDVAILCQTLKGDEQDTILEAAHGLQREMKCVVLGYGGINGLLAPPWLEGPQTLLGVVGDEKGAENDCSLNQLS